MNSLDTFDGHQKLIFSLAYRMLGTVADAEDIVQETFLRWQQTAASDIENPKAFLSTVATRLAIDKLRAAQTRREDYVGAWLPEPLVGRDSEDQTVLHESLSIAFMVLLEHLSPVERAVYLLREIFDYEYSEIAAIVDKNETACRQIVKRAKQHIVERRPRFHVDRGEKETMVQRFMHACQTGDVRTFMELLNPDAVLTSDGGGKVTAARKPVLGADKISRFIFGLLRKAPQGTALQTQFVNGEPGLVTTIDGEIHNVIAFDMAGGRIQGIYIVVNPDKLTRVSN